MSCPRPRLSPFAAVAYLAAATLATPAAAGVEAARALAGEVPKLRFLDAPADPPAATFTAVAGEEGEADLSLYAGRPVVLNYWATWCGPCRREMPSLQRLDDATDAVAVVTMAFGRHNPAAMRRFWEEAGVTTLPLHLDAGTEMARALGVRGLPHTVLLDAEGRVVAELVGEAEWDAPEMVALLEALAAPE